MRAEPGRDEDDFPCAAELDDDARLLAGEAPALDDVLALARVFFPLDRDDCAGEDDIRGVEDAEAALFEFFGRAPSDDIALLADSASLAIKNSSAAVQRFFFEYVRWLGRGLFKIGFCELRNTTDNPFTIIAVEHAECQNRRANKH